MGAASPEAPGMARAPLGQGREGHMRSRVWLWPHWPPSSVRAVAKGLGFLLIVKGPHWPVE